MKKVIYIVITGRYDDLHEPLVITPGWDYVCFTDDENLRSDAWDIRKLEMDPKLNNNQNAKKAMTLFHKFLPEYDLTLYTQGYSVVKCNLDDFLSDGRVYRPNYDICCLSHKRYITDWYNAKEGTIQDIPRRRYTAYDEADWLCYYYKEWGQVDTCNAITKQMECYGNDGFPEHRAFSTGIIIRRIGISNLEEFCELWWEEIKRHTGYDQLSLSYCLWKYDLVSVHTAGFRFFKENFQGEDHHKKAAGT